MSETSLVALTPGAAAVPFSSEDEKRFHGFADSLARRIPGLAQEREQYRACCLSTTPRGDVLAIHGDDFSGVSHIQGVLGLDYYPGRAFTRARDGDVVLGTFPPVPGYDTYLDERLGLGRPVYLQAQLPSSAPAWAVFTAVCDDRARFQQLVDSARSREHVVIHPYLGTPDAWRLARLLTDELGRSVQVVAPLPSVTRFANNKVSFLELVRDVVGDHAVVEMRSAASLDELVAHVRDMSARMPWLAIKLSDSASGMGTGIFPGEELRSLSDDELRQRLSSFLTDKEWQEGVSPAVTVERWEEAVLASPSAQLWIPPLSEGGPLVEGVFDQQFVPGRVEQIFLGSVPSRLPEHLRDAVRDGAARLGRVLQLLGYVGRCSFDTIVVGPDLEHGVVTFVECNARWGGTSTPMSFMNRLFTDYRSRHYVAADVVSKQLVGVSFDRFVDRLDDILYTRSGQGWAVVYNVGCLEPHGKFDVITLGDSADAARDLQGEFVRVLEDRF